ncbi:hypothetical protein FOZ60_016202 [Perkinsus olseni]|uniref:Uncharacterized protein n=1 Tax=Perkinsus olseni TaxID=32597 RepID=A0A7J6P4R2_PEROL|nr:hypothetical protein FOZ60_016202 [Perkinsus olseni]
MFHWLAMARGQLFGEILDIEDDAQVGKNTTAVKIGEMRSQQLMLALTVCSALVSYILVGSVVLTVYYVMDMVLSVFSRKEGRSSQRSIHYSFSRREVLSESPTCFMLGAVKFWPDGTKELQRGARVWSVASTLRECDIPISLRLAPGRVAIDEASFKSGSYG